jgi:uncharacterized protein (DUF1015 family)
MPRIAPFDALTYDVRVAGPLKRITTPPYDVISADERDRYASDPHSIVRVDLPGATHDADAYAAAARTLAGWIDEGALFRQGVAYHAYEMTHATGRVRGVFCAMDLEPWGGSVVPHERTMAGPLRDRLDLLRATRTHLSPIYGTVAGPCPELGAMLARTAASGPDAELTDGQGTRHRVWRVDPRTPIDRWVADEALLIADGHHRYTTALTYRDERVAAEGPGPWDRILTLLVDAGSQELPVRPFHRIQRSGPPPPPGRPVTDLAAALAAVSDEDVRVATVAAGPGGLRFERLDLPGEAPAVRALHETVLDGRVTPDELRFTPDPDQAVRAVQDGMAVAAYLLPGTTPDRIRKAIDRGERLPQKSTYFWPKPRTGLVLMPLDPADDATTRVPTA